MSTLLNDDIGNETFNSILTVDMIEKQTENELKELESMPGYFAKQEKYHIDCVSDFVTRMQRREIRQNCSKFLAQDDPDMGGFRCLFNDFYQQVKIALKQDKDLCDAMNENTEEIAEYVMR